MKKQDQHKLIVLSAGLVFFLSMPLILVISKPVQWMGIPLFHGSIFFVWGIATILQLVILKKYYR